MFRGFRQISSIVPGFYRGISTVEDVEDSPPIPLCTEDNTRYVCLRCEDQRMEHPHFTSIGVWGTHHRVIHG